MRYNTIEKMIKNSDFIALESRLKQCNNIEWNQVINECLNQRKIGKAKEYINIMIDTNQIMKSYTAKAIAGAMGALYDAKEFDLLDDYLENDFADAQSLDTEELKQEVLLELADVFFEKKELEKAKCYFKKYVHKMIQVEHNEYVENDTYYSFRSISAYTLRDLINNTITLSSPYEFNDPIDSLIYEAFRLKLQDEKRTIERDVLFKDALEQVRIRCFSTPKGDKEPYLQPLMWAHYADSHKGICIKYKLSHSFPKENKKCVGRFGKVRYSKESINIRKDKYEYEECFLTKQSEWEYENEVRLVYVDTDNTSNYISLDLDADSYVEAIYFGRKCSQLDISTIKTIFKDKNIDFGQMDFNPEKIFELRLS